MNIETRINQRIWDAIRSSYENRSYTGAIQDSIYFLSDLIREKTGLEGDGAPLVGQAFGGHSPLLKVNRMQTESEKNVQKGVEQLLRGLYQAVRNPRSHGKHSDTEQDAVAIILFVDYLVRIIDETKSPFLESEFISRVLDPDFVPKEKYAQLLVSEIPEKKRMDIFYGVFHNLSEADGDKLRFFFDALFEVVSMEEKEEIIKEVSKSLKQADDTETILSIIQAFPSKWPDFEESARLRIENKLIGSIKHGTYDPKKDRCMSGVFGAWATNITEHFSLKSDLLWVLTNKLGSSDRGEQEYVFSYFSSTFRELVEIPPNGLKNVIIDGLKSGDSRFRDLVKEAFLFLGDEWEQPFKASLESFEERPLPYDPEYDSEEIPF